MEGCGSGRSVALTDIRSWAVECNVAAAAYTYVCISECMNSSKTSLKIIFNEI